MYHLYPHPPLSPLPQVKVIKPPLLPGEVIVMDGVHSYLLPDGRENGLLKPADGHTFLTSYRLIFLGTPLDPQGMRIGGRNYI